MSFFEAISSGFSKYADFRGRSLRSEYWYWALFLFLGSVATWVIDALATVFILNLVFTLGTLLPSWAVSVRRLHDLDRSGWWILLGLIPFVGGIILLIWFVTEGSLGNNRYGPNPGGVSIRRCPHCMADNQESEAICMNCGGDLSAPPTSEDIEIHEAGQARFLVPLVGLLVGLIFSLVMLQATKVSTDTILESMFSDSVSISEPALEQLREELESRPKMVLFWPISSEIESLATGRTVRGLLWERVPMTLEVSFLGGGLAILFAWGLGLALGGQEPIGKVTRVFGALISSIPIFWMAILMVWLGAVRLGWFPAGTSRSFSDNPSQHFLFLAMPVLTLAFIIGPWLSMEMRSRQESPPLQLLRAFGLILRHFGMLLTGIILIEIVFALPGLGRLIVEATTYNSDSFVIGAAAALMVSFAIIFRFIGNLILTLADGTTLETITKEAPTNTRALIIKGGVIIGLLVVLFLLSFATPEDPLVGGIRDRLMEPGSSHILGTDHAGRDIFSRILAAGRITSIIAFSGTLVALLAGLPMYILRTSFDRTKNLNVSCWIEGTLEGLVAVPWLIVGILVQAKLGLDWPLLALVVILIPRALRVGWTLGEGERLGVANVGSMILRQGALFLAATTLISSTLSILGLGVKSPSPELGLIIFEGRSYIANASWIVIYPGLALTGIIATWLVVASLLSRRGSQHQPVGWGAIMS